MAAEQLVAKTEGISKKDFILTAIKELAPKHPSAVSNNGKMYSIHVEFSGLRFAFLNYFKCDITETLLAMEQVETIIIVGDRTFANSIYYCRLYDPHNLPKRFGKDNGGHQSAAVALKSILSATP